MLLEELGSLVLLRLRLSLERLHGVHQLGLRAGRERGWGKVRGQVRGRGAGEVRGQGTRRPYTQHRV